MQSDTREGTAQADGREGTPKLLLGRICGLVGFLFCGHLPHVERPELFVSALEGFLA